MARLIIGHTTENSTRIWIRGHSRYPVGFVSLEDQGGALQNQSVLLEARHGYTGIVDFGGLSANSVYQCAVTFGASQNSPPLERVDFGHCTGRVKTFPKSMSKSNMTFLLGSCNLHTLGELQSPDEAFKTLARVAESDSADFMIHCGDQIYYDIPNPIKPPSIEEYREKYLDAWSDSRPTRKFLTMLPQYMILDDHEMKNDFSNDMDTGWFGARPSDIRALSLKVYREFQHIRHPQHDDTQALYYEFAFGQYPFFVLDTRTERYTEKPRGKNEIISEGQLAAFKNWLTTHKAAVKFAVTSVPFVAEPRSSEDKWSAEAFLKQREEILQHLLTNQIDGLTFLTGDMHCSYHAQMDITDAKTKVTVHELMSSPINQLHKSSFHAFHSKKTTSWKSGAFKTTSSIDSKEFYGKHSNAMLIKVVNRTVTSEVFRTKKPVTIALANYTLR